MKKVYFALLIVFLVSLSCFVISGCGSAASSGGGGGSSTKIGNGILYAATYKTSGPSSILIFDNACSKDGTSVVPDRIISGDATLLKQPYGLFIDPNTDKLYVANYSGNHGILVFSNAHTINGNVTPEQVITSTPMTQPAGIFVRNNRIYVADDSAGGGILVFNTTDIGTVSAIAHFTTGEIAAAKDLYLDSQNRLYVSSYVCDSGINDHISVFNNADTFSGTQTHYPDRTISCEGLYYSSTVWVDETRNILFSASNDNGSTPGTGRVYGFNNASTLNGTVTPTSSSENNAVGTSYVRHDAFKDILYSISGNGTEIFVWDQASTMDARAHDRRIWSLGSGGIAGFFRGVAIDPTRSSSAE